MNIATSWPLAILLLGVVGPSQAVVYGIPSNVLNAGAGGVTSASFRLSASVGETVLNGPLSSASYTLKPGFVAQVNRPVAAISATAGLTFPGQNIGSTSAAQTVTINNNGAALLSLSGIATTGEFGQTATGCGAIAAGASCAINVTFAPAAAGLRTGSLTFASNAAGSPHIVALSGTGVLNAQTITFPGIPGQTLGTAPFAVTVSATSGLPVTLTSQTTPVCTVSGTTVTLVALGTCTLQATQSGNATFAAATPVSQSFAVAASGQGGNGSTTQIPLPGWALFLLGVGLMGLIRRLHSQRESGG
jgi:hypothetical protein